MTLHRANVAGLPAFLRAVARVTLILSGLLGVVGSSQMWGQVHWKVEGRVFDDETRVPIPGVNVLVRGLKIGTATDTTGYFSLTFTSSGSRILVFSHLAYKKRAYRVSPDSLNLVGGLVYLIPDTIRFSEVVVQGKRQVVPTKSAETAALHTLGGDEFERLGEEDMERALRYFLPEVVKRFDRRMRFDSEDFTLYVNGEFRESHSLDELDPFNIRRVMVWTGGGASGTIDLFTIGMPLLRGNFVVLIETKER
jgi:hypothetical protein